MEDQTDYSEEEISLYSNLICVICDEKFPNTKFSKNYRIREHNAHTFEKHFKRKIEYGPLCNRCYMKWYHQQREKRRSLAKKSSQSSSKRNTDSQKKTFELKLENSGPTVPTIKLCECIIDVMASQPEKKWTLKELAHEVNGPQYRGKVVNLTMGKVYTEVPEYSIQRCMCAKKQDTFGKTEDGRWYLQKGVKPTIKKRKRGDGDSNDPNSFLEYPLETPARKVKFRKLFQCIVREMKKQPDKIWTPAELSEILNSPEYKGTIINNSFRGKIYEYVSPLSVKICLSAKKKEFFDKVKKGQWKLQDRILRASKRRKKNNDNDSNDLSLSDSDTEVKEVKEPKQEPNVPEDVNNNEPILSCIE